MTPRGSSVRPSAERSYWQELRGSFGARTLLAEEDLRLAGMVSGGLWLAGGLTLLPLMVLPGVPHEHRSVVLAVALAALVLGLGSIRLVDRRSMRGLLFHVSSLSSAALIALAVSATGGASSPAWIYLFFIVLFTSYFYAPRVAVGYLILCMLLHGLPLLYDPRAVHAEFLAVWLLGATTYAVLGIAMIAGKTLMAIHRTRAERLVELHDALRTIATAVVDGTAEAAIYALVARQIAALIGGGASGIMRLDSAESMTVMGSWADHPGGRYAPGTVVPVRPGSDVEQALCLGRPVLVADHAAGSPVGRLGYSASLVAPVSVAGINWGVLAVTARVGAHLGAADEQRIMAFGDLLATAIKSLDDRAKLAAQALSDPLTGLANHRALHAELRAAVVLAAARREPLSVVVIDIDHFKQINDIGGHELGDETLARIAGCLRRLAGPTDVLGRAGGDEFTWVMPGRSRDQALAEVRAARAMIEAGEDRSYRMTVSAGICDLAVSSDPEELIRLADGALYWCKAHGRDQVQVYDPVVVDELSASDRAERLERSQTLVGLRALARAIDAKDADTREHSERVATLAGRLARVAGWSADRAQLLREAALVHDVGKIGVDDSILRKPGRLTDAERAQVNQHAELSARIVDGVLSDEQVDWIRTHHERPDGGGYPRGLRGEEIPRGGALLAIADAFDVMTVGRHYSARRTLDEALDECRGLAGAQFSTDAVSTLELLVAEPPGDGDPSPGDLPVFAAR